MAMTRAQALAYLARNPQLLAGRGQEAAVADLIGAGAVPQTETVTVTPASPAPVQSGVQVAAPQAVATDFRNQTALANAQGKSELQRADEDITAAREAEARRRALITQGAQMDSRELAILAAREERLKAQEAQVGADQKKAGWDMLANIGFKMAQSKSPYFMSALSEGIQAGLQGYNQSKADAAEKRARIQEAKENIEIAKITGEKAARKEILDEDTAANAAAAAQLQQKVAAMEARLKIEREPLERARLQAEIDQTRQAIAASKETVSQGWARINADKETAGAAKLTGVGDALKTLQDEYETQMKAAEDATSDADRNRYLSLARTAREQKKELMRRAGLLGGSGKTGGAKSSEYVYVPGKGLVKQ